MIDFFPVSANGDRIGNVTSACYSPRLEKNIGYAMVPIEFADLETELEIETPSDGTKRSLLHTRLRGHNPLPPDPRCARGGPVRGQPRTRKVA